MVKPRDFGSEKISCFYTSQKYPTSMSFWRQKSLEIFLRLPQFFLLVFLIAHCLGMSFYVNFLGGLGSNEFHIKWRFGTHGNLKNQNPGGRFGASS
jgi:hypothetical protein